MMVPAGQRPRRSPDRVRAELAMRLEARRPEIEETILTRLYAVSDPSGSDPEYLQGLRAAVTAGLDIGLLAIERGEERSGPIPAGMLTQARQAARNGIGLDTVLRRYVAGYTALGDFFMQEARDGDLAVAGATLYFVQRELAALFDRIVAAVTAEYEREVELASRTREQRLAERVERLLAGQLVDTAGLDYDFDAWHLGVIATGPRPGETLRELVAGLDCRFLLVERRESAAWAWLGARRKLKAGELARPFSAERPPGASLAIGEPAQGLHGWRLTHRQARAAQTVAVRRPRSLTRYADVALLASMLLDDVLVGFLSETYLIPLSDERDGGATLRQTLSAYFAAGSNVSSAAAILGVSRQTVTSRLRTIEDRLARPLSACAVEMAAALRLTELTPTTPRLILKSN
jgi:PucR-like helix-turn-helix protein/diguanylate cyclase with GGDEF domain